MKLPSFALSPPWPRFIAAGGIFLAWFVTSWLQPAVASPAEFVKIVGYTLVGLVFYHAGDKNPAPNSPAARLVGGAVLLAMWVGLVAKGAVPASNLIDAMVLILFGLGVLPSPDPATLQMPGSPPQAGFARWRMLAFLSALGLGGVSLLGGCASTPQAAQAQYVQECAAYGTALTLGAQMKAAGKLNAVQVQQLLLIDSQITPICSGQLPADPTSATQKVTAALTTLAILEGTKK